jgi:DNA-directed RNA polymerase sigma subunit (sigma70/sigma32)
VLREDVMWTREREAVLAQRMEAGKDAASCLAAGAQPEVELRALVRDGERARATFIEENLPLVRSRVRLMCPDSFNLRAEVVDDLVADATVALIVAVDKFDWRREYFDEDTGERRGVKFSTYACSWIDGALKRRFTKEAARPEPRLSVTEDWDSLYGYCDEERPAQ